MEDPTVTWFREYLRIQSVQPNPDYAGCVEFLRRACLPEDPQVTT